MNEALRVAIEELIESNRRLISLQSYWHSFLRGIFSAIGATVGAALAIALFVGLLNSLAGVDLFKPVANSLLPYVQRQSKVINSDQSFLPNPSYTTSPETSPQSSPALFLEE